MSFYSFFFFQFWQYLSLLPNGRSLRARGTYGPIDSVFCSKYLFMFELLTLKKISWWYSSGFLWELAILFTRLFPFSSCGNEVAMVIKIKFGWIMHNLWDMSHKSRWCHALISRDSFNSLIDMCSIPSRKWDLVNISGNCAHFYQGW